MLSPTLRHATLADTRPPTSAITSPVSGQIITATQYTLSGLASDDLSGIGGVQVSVSIDGAETWGQAITSGQSSRTRAWHYLWNIPNQDNVRPLSFINAPRAEQTLTCTTCVIRGSTVDGSGILTVEVSGDGKASWQPAAKTPNGSFTTTDWVYTWTVPHNGTFTIHARATDGAHNVEANRPSVTFSVTLGVYVVYLPVIFR